MFFSRKNKQRRELPTFRFCDPGAGGLLAWASVLPRKDSMALAKQLLQAGDELRASECTLGEMVELLEVLAEPIATAAEGLLLLRGTNERQIDIYRKRREFFNLFGQLYYSLAKKQQAINSSVHCEQLLLKASEFLCEAIIASHNLYQLPPADCWHALHAMFEYSVSDAYSESAALTLLADYKTVVALSCASPEKLSNAQIESLTELIRGALAGVRISSEPGDKTYYSVKLSCDHSPSRIRSIKNDVDSVYFDFTEMAALLSANRLSVALADNLKLSYGPSVARVFPRHLPSFAAADSRDAVLETCAGISAVHYYLCDEMGFEGYIDRYHRATTISMDVDTASRDNNFNDITHCDVNFDSSDVNPRHSREHNDVWSSIYSTNWHQFGSVGDAIESEIIHQAKNDVAEHKRDFPIQLLSIKDLNAKGYCLLGSSSALKRYKTGSLLGIKNLKQQHWHVAIVRWSKTDDDKKSLGIELLDPNIQACALKIVHSTHGTELLPAFLLPIDAVVGVPGNASSAQPRILTPRLSLKGKASAVLVVGDSRKQVLLDECLEQGASFGLYSYKTLAEDEAPVENVVGRLASSDEKYYE